MVKVCVGNDADGIFEWTLQNGGDYGNESNQLGLDNVAVAERDDLLFLVILLSTGVQFEAYFPILSYEILEKESSSLTDWQGCLRACDECEQHLQKIGTSSSLCLELCLGFANLAGFREKSTILRKERIQRLLEK